MSMTDSNEGRAASDMFPSGFGFPRTGPYNGWVTNGRFAARMFAPLPGLALLAVVSIAAAGSDDSAPPPVAVFEARVKEYLELRDKAASGLPKLSKESKPEEVVGHQHALAARIKAARSGARPGDFFSPDLQALVKRTVAEVLSGPDAKTVKASIMDENPGKPRLAVNEPYPTSVPLSTMPPQILAPLPRLPKGLEFRFLGPRLILLDTEADLIIDFTDGVIPP